MTDHRSPADRRPFQAKAQLETEHALEERYAAVAIPEVVEALQHVKTARKRDPYERNDR